MLYEKNYFFKGLVLFALFLLVGSFSLYARTALGSDAPGLFDIIYLPIFFLGFVCLVTYFWLGLNEFSSTKND